MRTDRQKQQSTGLDEPPPAPVLEFDLSSPWPQKYFGQRFGPALIHKALKSGYYVLCEINGIPRTWAVSKARWEGTVLEIYSGTQGWRVPKRIWSTKTLKGFKL